MSRTAIKPAGVDFIAGGRPHGSVAARLLANAMNPSALRTNDVLRKDEWKRLDETVVQIARERLVGVADLVNRGLTYPLANGLGTTVLEWEDVSDMEDAELDMAAETMGDEDLVKFSINYLPLPIVHKSFRINIRKLEASRSRGESLDVTQAAVAAEKVSEKIEDILFNGASTYTFGGGTLYGYTDFTSRNTGSLGTNWDDSGADPVSNVLAMKQASINDRHYGPWGLYVPTNFETALDEDYNASYPSRTMRQRLLDIDGIEFIRVADKLTADNVVMVQLSALTARVVIGMQPTTVEWQTQGGFIFHFKVMAVMVPHLRADQDGRAGIMHWS